MNVVVLLRVTGRPTIRCSDPERMGRPVAEFRQGHYWMASSINTVQYICDQAGLGRRLAFRKMFGEYALYVDGKVVALVCDDQLFLKPTVEGSKFLGKVVEAPPYPGAKNHFLLASEMDDPERLGTVLGITAQALPAPKPGNAKPKPAPKRKASKRKASR